VYLLNRDKHEQGEIMKKQILPLALLLAGTLYATEPTVVVTQVAEGEDSIKVETGSYQSDYLYLGKELDFSGEVEDLIFMGERLDFKGSTEKGIVAGGQTVNLNGITNNGVISGARNLDITGVLNGTSFLGAKDIHIRETATVNGDLFIGCGEITIDGAVDGNIYLGTGLATINSEINGDVTAHGGRILFGENGRINGNLSYKMEEQLSSSEQEKISGTVTFEESDMESGDMPTGVSSTFGMLFKLYSILSFLVIGVILISLPIGGKVEQTLTTESFWKTAGWGIIPICMYPAVLLLSVIMGITIPLALILLLAMVPLFYVTLVIGSTLVGQAVVKKFNWSVSKRQFHFLIGAVIYSVLSIIPFIDFLAFVLLTSLGWGVITKGIFNKTPHPSQLQIENE